MDKKTITRSVRISAEAIKDVKRHLIENSGTIRSFIEKAIETALKKRK